MIVFCSWVSFCLIKTEKGGEVPARTALGKVDSNSKHIDIRYASLKFIYSEKATKFCEISTNYLSHALPEIIIIGGDLWTISEYLVKYG